MNKELLQQTLKGIVSDRPVLLLVLGQILAAIVYMVIVGFSINASDVTVYTRYTSFGEAHFYKSQWQYLILFVSFGLLVAGLHISLMGKLHEIGRRQSALFVGWIGIVIILLALIYSLAVISLGRAT